MNLLIPRQMQLICKSIKNTRMCISPFISFNIYTKKHEYAHAFFHSFKEINQSHTYNRKNISYYDQYYCIIYGKLEIAINEMQTSNVSLQGLIATAKV